jgi:hypothetical protein
MAKKTKRVHILNVVNPERVEMHVKQVIDMHENPIAADSLLEKAMNDTPDKTIVITSGKKNTEEYMEFGLGFDIETTQVNTEEYHRGYMYKWMLGFGDYIVTGRKWTEWRHVMAKIQDHYLLQSLTYEDDEGNQHNIKRQAILWIANSGFEFQFISKQKHNDVPIMLDCMDKRAVFADHSRKPVTFEMTFNPMLGAGFKCLDALRIGGPSLATVADNYCVSKKLKGDLDYSRPRNSMTPLTPKEDGYCYHDVKILIEWDHFYKEAYMKQVGFVPCTSTALIRKAVSQNWNSLKFPPHAWLYNMMPHSMDEYITAVCDLYRGGYTHANVSLVGKLLEGVRGMDFTSSYPATLLQQVYPLSDFKEKKDMLEENLINFTANSKKNGIKKYCWYAKITFYSVRPKTSHSLESIYKVEEYRETGKSERRFIDEYNAIVDNGKILAADQMTVTITDEDFDSYRDIYNWEWCEIHYFKYAKAGYLPEYFTSVIKEMYKRKSVLKKQGLDGTIAYIIAKSFVNGLYGLSVQKLHFEDVIYNVESGWRETHTDENGDEHSGKVSLSECKTEKEYYDKIYRDMILYDKLDKNGNPVGIRMKLFLSPYWGIWCTAYARRRIMKAIVAVGDDAIYSDTDSLYFINYEKHKDYFDNWNKEMTARNKELFGADFAELGDLGTFDPVCIKADGKKFNEYTFMTFGAKRYIKYSKENDIEVTIAGLPKKAMQSHAMKYLEKKHFDNPKTRLQKPTKKEIVDVIVNDFSNTLHLSIQESMKKTHAFNDSYHSDLIIDDFGNEELMEEESSMCVYSVDFSMNVDKKWRDMSIEMQNNTFMLAIAKMIQEKVTRFND